MLFQELLDNVTEGLTIKAEAGTVIENNSANSVVVLLGDEEIYEGFKIWW